MNEARLTRWATALLARGPRRLSLDEVGDVIGTESVTPDEIDALLTRLEAAGAVVDSTPSASPREHLATVLRAARELKARGRAPTPQSIADVTGLALDEVRGALLFARVLQR